MIFDTYAFSSHGGRPYNEDSAGYQTEGDHGIFVVADGLGGHSFGELASAHVRDALLDGFPCQDGDPAQWLASQVSIANQGVLALQREKNALMKSTAVVLYIMGNRAVWAHVGDSRLYYVHEGRIKACTEDHSVAYKKYKAGEITKREIAFDEDQPRLLRAIGGEDHSEPVIRVYEELLSPGDGFFLCTDGAWEFLDDEEIAIDLLKSSHARQWTEYLLMRMMDRIKPGNDNLTALSVILNYDKTY